jgi:opacity protein-like surface antigen
MVKKIRKVLLPSLACSVALVSTAFAYNFTPKEYAGNVDKSSPAVVSPGPWFVGVSAGVAWPGLPNSATVPNGFPFAPPQNLDLFSIQVPSAAATWALNVGYRWVRSTAFFPLMSLALRYAHINAFNASGLIEVASDPLYTNYSYSAKISPNIFTLFGKIDIYNFHSFLPYISLGLGESWNTFTNYTQQGINDTYSQPGTQFGDNTTARFTYNFGVGIDYLINPRSTLSLGYEYADLGKVISGNGTQLWSNTSLSMGDLTSNTVLLGINYQLPT